MARASRPNQTGRILGFLSEFHSTGKAAGGLAVLLLIILGQGAVRAQIHPTPAKDNASLPSAGERKIDYEKEIRPIFESHCYACHGPAKQKSGFRLDQKAPALKGGDRGPDLLPGRGAESPLVQFVSGSVEDMFMPPRKSGARPLTAAEISLLQLWIDQGAVWPEGSDSNRTKAKTDFWTFKPVERPALPPVSRNDWARNEVDRFILATLERESLHPSPEADKRTLIRRLSFDMTGLPPLPSEVDEFVQDPRPDAYEHWVDRYLDSPRYGERWARHWLDTVHYGETHGYDKDKPRPNAWPYRDYVIRALNQDKPYDRFVQEQLAGDVLFPEEPDGVVALGFIAAGPWDFVGHVELAESKTDGLIARYNDRDDMVMTTMSTFQSLTVHCARCHDHKFDPISQEEYYNLQAVFAGVDRADRWFDTDPALFARRERLLREKKELRAARDAIDARIAALSPQILKLVEARQAELKKEAAALRQPKESPGNGYHSEVSAQADASKWVQLDLGKEAALDEIRLIPARPTDFPDTPGFGFPARFKVEVGAESDFKSATRLLDETTRDFANPGDNPVVIPASGKSARFVRITATRLWPRTGDYVFALGEVEVTSRGTNIATGAQVTAQDSIESGRWSRNYLADGYDSRKRLESEAAANRSVERANLENVERQWAQLEGERKALIERLLDAATLSESDRVNAALLRVNESLGQLPPAQKVFAAANDFAATGSFHPAREPRQVSLLRRGEVKQPIHPATPGALDCLPGLSAKLAGADFSNEGNRRAALAAWITAPTNLLTRRSIVNRIWHYHFGRGLVETPNDFGHMGALPSHPELLDWLAFWFREHGGSIKQLHRLLLTSSTYRQAACDNTEAARIDGDNRFLWRMNRARLDSEEVRDSILFVSGQLDLAMGGPSVQQFFFKDDHSPVYDYSRFDIGSPPAWRRSIYRFIVRSVADPFMETLDCPDSSLLAPKRDATLTALQALALLNDPLVLRQAGVFAQRVTHFGSNLREQVSAAYRLALSRPPTAAESTQLVPYAEKYGMANLCRLILNSNEFMFVD